jgi:hypothetical protein
VGIVPCHGTLRVNVASGWFEFIPTATEAAAAAEADTVVVPSYYRVLPGTFVVAEFQGDEAEANQSLFWVQGEQEDMDGVKEYTGFWLHTIPEIENTPSHVTIARNLCCKDSHHVRGSHVNGAVPVCARQLCALPDGTRRQLADQAVSNGGDMHELDAEVIPPSPSYHLVVHLCACLGTGGPV